MRSASCAWLWRARAMWAALLAPRSATDWSCGWLEQQRRAEVRRARACALVRRDGHEWAAMAQQTLAARRAWPQWLCHWLGHHLGLEEHQQDGDHGQGRGHAWSRGESYATMTAIVTTTIVPTMETSAGRACLHDAVPVALGMRKSISWPSSWAPQRRWCREERATRSSCPAGRGRASRFWAVAPLCQ